MADGPKGLGYYYTKPKPKVAAPPPPPKASSPAPPSGKQAPAAGAGTTAKKPAGPPVRTHAKQSPHLNLKAQSCSQTSSGQT